ncbi:MAG: hypothetical protein GY838_13945 [bacterium]|nr:hypothetical protein [bacterium]
MKTLCTSLLLALLVAPAALADTPGIGGGPHESSLVYLGGPDVAIPATWASLYALPDGSGPGLDQAFMLHGYGSLVDATVYVTVIHPYSGVLIGYPAEDMWLEGAAGGLVPCSGHIIADSPSDAEGRTSFSHAPAVGGWTEEGLLLMFNGDAWIGPVLPIRINSPDINADGLVNLSDSGFFATDLFIGPYDYRSDFNGDGSINLSDAGIIMGATGRNCR